MDTTYSVSPDALALQRLYYWEKTAPNTIALTQPSPGGVVTNYTWAQLLDQTRRMAAHIKSLGLPPGARIALLSKNTAHWLMADFSIWMAGYVSVPLYPTLAAGTVRQILEHSEAKLLFVGKLDGWESMKPGVPDDVQCISLPLAPPNTYQTWESIVAKTEPLKESPVRDGADLATIMYTSGTTGMPKGVMHSFAGFAWSLQSGIQRLTVEPGARMLSYLPLAHVAERILIEHGLLAAGMHVFFAESLDTFTADLQRARPTIFFSVPRLWVKFQQGVQAKMPEKKLARLLKIPILKGIVRKKILGALGLDQCKVAAGGAAPMPPDLLRWYARLGLEIMEVYGMTENCGISHGTLIGQPRPGTVGPPHAGVLARVAPESGEVQVKSGGMLLGYYKEPELSRAFFTEDGWIRTGDKGTIDSDGILKITGRVKDLFKTSKGKYVAPAPIEDKIVMHASVEACCVTGANLGQPLGLAMLNPQAADKAAGAAGRAELEESMKAHLEKINALLDPHERMDCIVLVTKPWTVDNDLITPTLKVKRNRIDEVYSSQYEKWVEQKSPVIWA